MAAVRPLHRSRDHLRRRTGLRELLRALPARLDLPPLRHQLPKRNDHFHPFTRRPPYHLREPYPPMEMEDAAKKIRNLIQRRPHAREDDKEARSEEHTSELQSRLHLVCRLLLEKKKKKKKKKK